LNTILIAGATGNLGGKIIDALLTKNVNVKAIVRMETSKDKIEVLLKKGVKVVQIDMSNLSAITAECKDIKCVISVLSGLSETIVDTQKVLLDGAIKAGVPRFIASDFSIDFTNLVKGQNRNLDFRRYFHTLIDEKSIKVTSIFNGAFMDLLTTDMPLIINKYCRILCWGDPNQVMEFTTTVDVANYTANVAIDIDTPRYLRIAGDRLSCNQFVDLMTSISGKKYKLLRPGSIGLFNLMIKMTKFFSPSPTELYPPWQGMQYMRDMMEGRVKFNTDNNDRYIDMKWTKVRDFLEKRQI
jgi:NmrA-like family